MLQLFRNIGALLTLESADRVKRGRLIETKDLSILKNAAMLVNAGQIVWVGGEKELTSAQVQSLNPSKLNVEEVNLHGAHCMPSFIESHTHLVFAGHRRHEFELRNQGVTYQEISKQGGGINSTVGATRAATFEILQRESQEKLNRFIKQGVTACEIKSGYGLNFEDEIKMLEVAQSLGGCDVVTTYLGPHAFPKDVSAESYFEEILNATLPEVAKRKLAERVDIFIESGFYSLELGLRYFKKAKELGLNIVAHVEQMSHLGGARLATELNALSVDHVVHLSSDDIQAIAKSETIATLLPAADFYLKIPYPKARELLNAGVRVALATDFNPGSSPTQDLSFVGVLARLEMKMSLAEVIVAYTLNAAKALKRDHLLGSLTIGKRADFVVLSDEYESLFYQVGHHPVAQTYRAGIRQFED